MRILQLSFFSNLCRCRKDDKPLFREASDELGPLFESPMAAGSSSADVDAYVRFGHKPPQERGDCSRNRHVRYVWLARLWWCVIDDTHQRKVPCRFMSARCEIDEVVIEGLVPGVAMADLVSRPDDQ